MRSICLLLCCLLSSTVFSQEAKQLAHYPFSSNGFEKESRTSEARLKNAPVSAEGVYLGGKYGNSGNLVTASVTGFNAKDFSVQVSFKIDSESIDRPGMNVISLSRSCRYFNLYINPENNIGIKLSNGRFREYSDFSISPNTWYTAICTYNSARKQARLYVNGKALLEVEYDISYSFCNNTTDWSTTDFGNGNSFKGYQKDWKFYNKALSLKEISMLDLDNDGDSDGDPDDGNIDNNNDDPDDGDKEGDHDGFDDTEITKDMLLHYTDVELSAKPFNYTQIAPRPDGHSYLAWNEYVKDKIGTFGKLHITTLDKSFNKVGEDIVLPDYEIRQVLAIDNDYLYLIVGERKNNKFTEWYIYDYLEANILHFMKIDKRGNVLFKTTLLGDKGQGPGAIWADNGFGTRYETKLAYNGTHFALYTGIRRNFSTTEGKSDVHEGDMFMIIDKNGKVLADKTQRWYSSHAFYLKLAINDKSEFITANLGDAYPVGILVRNRNNGKNANVWPPEKITYQSGKTWYFAAGYIGELLVKDDQAYLIHASSQNGETKRKEATDVLFLKMNDSFEVQKKKWLTSSTNNEKYVYAGWLGNRIVVAYSAYDNYNITFTKLALLDTEGNSVAEPIEAKIKLNFSSSHFVPFPDGSLVISQTDAPSKTIKLMRVKGK